MKIYNSTHNFYKANTIDKFNKYNSESEINKLELVRNEEFGFFVSFDVDSDICVNLNNQYDLAWWGLDNHYRISVDAPIDVNPHLIGYVRDDDNIEKADIILEESSSIYSKGEVPIFIDGKVLPDFDDNNFQITIKLYKSNGYNKELLIDEVSLDVDVIDFNLDMQVENSFFLDLWQHLSSWARVYNVDYFSNEHFEIIENYIIELAKLGQKVIDLIVSDFPWAGQQCFAIKENASRLYEYNIIKVKRKNGKIECDFTNMDRYIDLCMKYGIRDEINVFGLIGNWHAKDFGSPLKDYTDPIRVKVYDEDQQVYDFIRTKDELGLYIEAIFNHLDELNLLDITKVVADEPIDNQAFISYLNFLNEVSKKEIVIKSAICSSKFFENYNKSLDSFSLNTPLLGKYQNNQKLIDNSNQMTWYACCIPDNLNTFIKSPLIEARYMGIYTYLWNLKGMLRWAYGIYVEDIYHDITYKPANWAAGDMYFVYPGKMGHVVHSLREKNMLYGIQDFNLFRQLELRGIDVRESFNQLLGLNGNIKEIDGDVVLDDYKIFNDYLRVRNEIIKKAK